MQEMPRTLWFLVSHPSRSESFFGLMRLRADRGQGLNHAINDSVNFVAALQKVQKGEASLEEAISAYDDEVVKRGADEVVLSKQSGLMFLNWDQLMNSPVMKAGLSRNTVSPTKS